MKKMFSILMVAALMLASSFAFSKTIEVRVVNTNEVFVAGACLTVWFAIEGPSYDNNFPGWGIYIIDDEDYVTQITFSAPEGYEYYDSSVENEVYTYIVIPA